MKPFVTLSCLCILAIAAPAFAQNGQLFLNFDDCYQLPIRNKNLDCTSTTSTTVLVASATPISLLPDVIADQGYIDVFVGNDPLTMPPFWQFQQGGCAGPSRLLFSADFTTSPGTCADVWGGVANTAGYWGGASGPLPDGNRARIKWATNVVPQLNFPMNAFEEAYIEKITMRQAPLATCPGCNTPVCAVYMNEQFQLLEGGSYTIEGGAVGTEFLSINDPTNQMRCPPLPDPVHSSTWGQVKSLYR